MAKFSWIATLGTKIISILSAVVAITLISYSGYVIYDSLYTEKAAFSSWDLSGYRPTVKEDGMPSFEEMQEINPDTVGWIKINGTNIDYPIVQGKDDIEYAHKDIFGKASLSGAIYLTTANTKDFTNSFNLLYGHYMANGAMFGDIEKYKDHDYFYKHQEGILITTAGIYDLKIFARLGTDAYDSRIYSAGDRKSSDFPDFLEYVQSIAIQWDPEMDIYDTTDRIKMYLAAREENMARNGKFVFNDMPMDVKKNGRQLLAMSTCADATTNGRQILIATMQERLEPLPSDVINDDDVPLAAVGHGGLEYWAFLNLLCLILIAYTLVPLLDLKNKYGRVSLMKKAEKAGWKYDRKSLRNLTVIGFIVEVLITIGSAILFMRVTDFKKPMTVVDQYTPYMLLLLALMILVDWLLFKYRGRTFTPEMVEKANAKRKAAKKPRTPAPGTTG